MVNQYSIVVDLPVRIVERRNRRQSRARDVSKRVEEEAVYDQRHPMDGERCDQVPPVEKSDDSVAERVRCVCQDHCERAVGSVRWTTSVGLYSQGRPAGPVSIECARSDDCQTNALAQIASLVVPFADGRMIHGEFMWNVPGRP